MTHFTALSRFRCTRSFKHITFIVLLCFITLLCASCVSTKVQHLPITENMETPSIAMRMYLEKPGAGELDNVINGLQSNLFFKNAEGKYVQVSSSQSGQWILKNAPAGTYRLELAESLDYNGEVIELSGSRTCTFRLPADKRAEVKIILKKTPVGLIVVLSVVIIGLIILAIVLTDDVPDLPMPPQLPDIRIPPPPLILPLPRALFYPPTPRLPGVGPLPPPPIFIDFGFYIAPHAATYTPPAADYYEADAPEVVHFLPPDGSVDVPTSSTINIFFSGDIDERCLQDTGFITVEGNKSGTVTGETAYIPAERMLEYIPEKPFADGEQITVYLDGDNLHESVGHCLRSDYQWSFSTRVFREGSN